jgi:hypothetical protein
MRVKIVIVVLSLLGLLVCAGAIGFVLLRSAIVPSSVGLTAQPGDTIVDLQWQPIAGARGYFIFRDNGSLPLNPTPTTDTHWQDIGLTNGRTYTYTIAPVNQDGQAGPRSHPIQVTPR